MYIYTLDRGWKKSTGALNKLDHARPTELLKLAYELLFQMGLLWLARPSQLCLWHLEMDELEMVWQTRLKWDMKASR